MSDENTPETDKTDNASCGCQNGCKCARKPTITISRKAAIGLGVLAGGAILLAGMVGAGAGMCKGYLKAQHHAAHGYSLGHGFGHGHGFEHRYSPDRPHIMGGESRGYYFGDRMHAHGMGKGIGPSYVEPDAGFYDDMESNLSRMHEELMRIPASPGNPGGGMRG